MKNESIIASRLGAVLMSAELASNGDHRGLSPCDVLGEKGSQRCHYRVIGRQGPCKHPEGLIPQSGIVMCPLQLGNLKVVIT